MDDAAFRLPESWPVGYDKAGAERLIERFAACGRAESRLVQDGAVRALLAALGGNSPYLSDLAVRESATLRRLIARGPDEVAEETLAALGSISGTSDRAHVAAAMRQAKRRIALLAAVADIGGIWPLERVTEVLTRLAETALARAVEHLLRAAETAGELRLPDNAAPAAAGGLAVLGMGKLGARELNYSSDVDLVLLYDPAAGVYRDAEASGAGYTRLARGLIGLMEARDANGYVFRTDLRLRPDPAATPPAVALPAAIAYYESMGQNWERAAMVKARPVAGDLAMGYGFLDAIRPFIWRRGLDFAAIADINAMKRRIDAHKGGALARGGDPVRRIAGHNVKLGEGGIREIEFLVQTLELVWGGRDPSLREPTTLGALRLLARAGRLAEAEATELAEAYRFLRTVEHRLQMVADRQTHTLPTEPEQLARFAAFMGFSSVGEFAEALVQCLLRVSRRYTEVFQAVPGAPADGPAELDFRGDEVPAATTEALEEMGFTEPRRIVDAVQSWQAGRVRALRSDRARLLMNEVLPHLLAALARQPRPDAVFTRFQEFLARLPAGVGLLSLFQHNTRLLDRIAAVLGAAPPLADHLARHPAAVEGLLAEDVPSDPRSLLGLRLEDARLLEEVIEIVRRTVREEDFSLAVATMEGRIDADEAGLRRTALADAALGALLPAVLDDLATRYGWVPGGAMAVLALGKAGGREMLAGSDLDLMLMYDHPEDVSESMGERRLPASQWFVRAAHAFVAAVTSPGADGPLYAIDMRLRPSGNKGPVAVSMAAFRRYHAESAWTWERMALTRARVVAGPAEFCPRVEAAISEALTRGYDAARVRADAAAMRGRMLPPDGPWDVKHRPGGLIDVEFIAQVLQLVHVRERPDLASPTTRIALANLRRAGLLSAGDAGLLLLADRVWRTVQGMLRITVGRATAETLPEASAEPLLRAVAAAGLEAVDVPRLGTSLDELAQEVRAAFVRLVGPVGGERTMSVSAKHATSAGLKAGDPAPGFDLPASGGRRVSLDAMQGRAFLLYFYPKADTPGCTKEACAFQEALPALGKIGLEVIGVSRDGMKAIERFAEKYGLSFPLASDEAGKVSEAYGTWVEKSRYGRKYMGVERASFLIDKAGKIARVWRPVKVDGHAHEVMEAARELG